MVLSISLLIPTLVPSESMPAWFNRVFSKKIQLGLDLQGGLYTVYSIDLDKAVDDKASEIKREFDAKMAERSIAGRVTTPRQPVGAINVILEEEAQKSAIDADFLSDYAEILENRDCPEGLEATSVCLLVSPEYADGIRKSAQEQALIIIRDRINKRGVAEPSVKSKGNQIVVELPGLDEEEIERVKDLIGRTAKLEFKMVAENSEYMRELYQHVSEDAKAKELGIDVGVDFWSHDESGKQYQDYYLSAGDVDEWLPVAEAKERGCWNANKSEVQGEVQCTITGRQRIADYLDELFVADAEMAIDDEHQIGYQLVNPESVMRDQEREAYWRTYYLNRPVELSGSSIADAYKYWDPTTNRPSVLIVFNRYGGRRFGDMTSVNIGKKMAIILDETVNSAPVIQDAITGGRSTITMGGSSNAAIEAEADDLVSVLKTGSLPAPLQEDSSSVIGPLLGADAIEKAQFAFALGALLVLIIMVFIYRVSGWLSMVALVLNIGFMMAILAALGATLTLPGIAALVLTVGMAVDANIIIYERIREELRLGKSVRGAVDAGFSRGFSAIFDGQITTAVAAYVLLQYGSGPIRGFAVMLIIGIGCTLFTATWCTRLFFEYYVGKGRKVEQLSI
ncbi:protein translocase subunit SecD [Haliangium ochraceum]|uniref:protein translocase subunit SecD n=1 Tax=Haliangium ochraceum TaxID=80816 RepID=UPI00019BAD91|nr:protein translocase subunit SecD [Haliangium ochraceum]